MTRTVLRWIFLFNNKHDLPGASAPGFCFNQYNLRMTSRKWIGIVFIGLAVIGLLISSWPTGIQKVTIPISFDPELSGTIELSVPAQVRVGDSSSVRMAVEITNGVPDTDMELVSHFEIGGVGVTPLGELRTLVNPLVPTIFEWSLIPKEQSVYKGTLWLFTGQNRQLVLAREVNLKAVGVLGLTPIVFRIVSILLMLLAVIILLPRNK